MRSQGRRAIDAAYHSAFARRAWRHAAVPWSETATAAGARRVVELRERPRRVLAHERLVVVMSAGDHVRVLGGADMTDHHARVAL